VLDIWANKQWISPAKQKQCYRLLPLRCGGIGAPNRRVGHRGGISDGVLPGLCIQDVHALVGTIIHNEEEQTKLHDFGCDRTTFALRRLLCYWLHRALVSINLHPFPGGTRGRFPPAPTVGLTREQCRCRRHFVTSCLQMSFQLLHGCLRGVDVTECGELIGIEPSVSVVSMLTSIICLAYKITSSSGGGPGGGWWSGAPPAADINTAASSSSAFSAKKVVAAVRFAAYTEFKELQLELVAQRLCEPDWPFSTQNVSADIVESLTKAQELCVWEQWVLRRVNFDVCYHSCPCDVSLCNCLFRCCCPAGRL
jgi:hypothetical protein